MEDHYQTMLRDECKFGLAIGRISGQVEADN